MLVPPFDWSQPRKQRVSFLQQRAKLANLVASLGDKERYSLGRVDKLLLNFNCGITADYLSEDSLESNLSILRVKKLF